MTVTTAPQRRSVAVVVTILALLATLAVPPSAAEEVDGGLPIVFVHGGAGSGAQYETQAKRWTSNGYAAELISAFEYNSASPIAIILAPSQLDAHIDAVRAEHDVDQVYLIGHSLGTTVSGLYLGQSARAAKVAGYIGIDGAGGVNCPGGVPCMGIWANETGNLGGNNLHLPGQTHVEVAVSAESFVGQYTFITGQEPTTSLVLPEPPGLVEISGRVVHFPANSATAGATLNIWEVNRHTGHRKYDAPTASFAIDASGDWGPARVNGQQHYEFEVVRDGHATGHTYTQPFLRSSHLVRILASPDGSAVVENTNVGDGHAAGVVLREAEWWGSREPSDQLWISTSSPSAGDQEPVDVLDGVTANNTLGIHVHDAEAAPEETTGDILPWFAAQAFQTGVDVYMPAASPPDGTISFVNAPRGDTERLQAINIPNWASSDHRFNVRFNDFVQDINTWGECVRQRPSPCR
jgi:pimeloyl-ACP methyl ester carboxylesterase